MDLVIKFFEYIPYYVLLVLVPAIVRTLIDTIILKIPSSCFELPSSRISMFIKFEDVYASFVSVALVAPLLEELLFRAVPYALLGFTGLILGNIVWVLAHPSWQLRYVSGFPLKTKLGFLANTVFYYSCAAVFFTIPWLQGYGLLAIIYHIAHNGILTLGGVFSEIEFPAPWKREDAEFFRESRGLRKKLEEKFFVDTNAERGEDVGEDEQIVDFDRKFFKEVVKYKPTMDVKTKPTNPTTAKTVAKTDIGDDWLFWRL